MPITTLFFDLDNTLYPSDNGIWAAIGHRMNIFIGEQLNLPPEEISTLRQEYYEKFGTTLKGLQENHDIDPDIFLEFVHDLPIEDMIKPDPGLRAMLVNLPLKKLIFTNSNIEHADRILNSLHLDDCFDKIIDIRALKFHCKPDPTAYHLALEIASESEPENCIFLDDTPRNLKPAFDLGFYTILVGTTEPNPVAYHSLKRTHDLQYVMPYLWQQ